MPYSAKFKNLIRSSSGTTIMIFGRRTFRSIAVTRAFRRQLIVLRSVVSDGDDIKFEMLKFSLEYDLKSFLSRKYNLNVCAAKSSPRNQMFS